MDPLTRDRDDLTICFKREAVTPQVLGALERDVLPKLDEPYRQALHTEIRNWRDTHPLSSEAPSSR